MRDLEAMIERQVSVQIERPIETINKAHGRLIGDVRAILAPRMRNFLREHPMRAASLQQAAIHEAGHLVSYELGGLIAWEAEVRGSPFGHWGWGGRAACCGGVFLDTKTGVTDLLKKASAAVAGPIAEALLGRGDVFSSVGELLTARVLIDRAARKLGADPDELAHSTLHQVAADIEENSLELREIADRLCRRRNVSRDRIKVQLAALRHPADPIEISQRAELIIHRIERVFGFGPLCKIKQRSGSK